MRRSHYLPDYVLEPLIRTALDEDIGQYGDMTTNAVVPAGLSATAHIRTRREGVVSGLQIASLIFHKLDPAIALTRHHDDGDAVAAGETVATITGSAATILMAERTALNFMSHLSGIATLTARFVERTAGTGARITCTRKTTPGLRAVEKQAIVHGGGYNHRFSLSDAILIKDNHIQAAGGIKKAMERTRAAASHMVRIEVEVDTLEQLAEVLETPGADCVLLDNMAPDILRAAVRAVDGRLVTEASGTVLLDDIAAIAATGVDYISSGALTHSAPVLDIGLDFE